MSFSRMMRRLSSSLLGELNDEDNEANNAAINGSRPSSIVPEDDPVLFCKNNVCIHPPSSISTRIDHCPGYLSIKSHMDQYGGTTLFLTWIPNSQLKANRNVAESLASGATPLLTPPPPKSKVWRSRGSSASSDQIGVSDGGNFFFRVGSEGANMFESIKGFLSGPPSRAQSRPESPADLNVNSDQRVVKKIGRLGSSTSSEEDAHGASKVNPAEFQALLADINNFCLSDDPANPQTSPRKSSNQEESPAKAALNGVNRKISNGSSTSSPFSPYTSNHFTYPDEKFYDQVYYSNGIAEERGNRDHAVGVLTADLNQMRSIRLFFSDERESSGQLVLASVESQYKIFHFHTGGLDRLSGILQSYQNCNENTSYREDASGNAFQFSVSSLAIPPAHCHRDEGQYSRLTREQWTQYVNELGAVENDTLLRKHVFFGGLEPQLRKEVWPFLLMHFPFCSTTEERAQMSARKAAEYQAIQERRGSMAEAEMERFWRDTQTIVDKDVVRTDRSNPFFKGECNPNLQIMRNILLNYAVYNPIVGYMQGMSDLLAPILAELKHESDTFWCFVGLMHGTIFISSPTDKDMDVQLSLVRELLRLFCPDFFIHLDCLGEDALELLFCHRWILLCFKREFIERDALRIWEACWSRWETDYFHLFVCVAIMQIYGEDVHQKGLAVDEMLLHFNTLAMHMSVDLVLKVARGLVYQFKSLTNVPCTLQALYRGDRNFYTQSLPVNVQCVHTNLSPAKAAAQGANGYCPFEQQRITSVKDYLRTY